MIGKLSGIVDSIYEDHMIIDVSGVGYMVFCTTKTLGSFVIGQATQLFIDTHVREDNISLFGFKNSEEKLAFLTLQTVSGIGTRMALAILAYFTPDELNQAILSMNKDAFRRVSGVGPKLADRILVELKGKTFGNGLNISNIPHIVNNVIEDASSALMNLGMQRAEVHNVINSIIKDDPEITLDKLIRTALQKRAKERDKI